MNFIKNFIKGFILSFYLVFAFSFLGENNFIYLSMIVIFSFLVLALFWKQI